jgi:hypothetical protein
MGKKSQEDLAAMLLKAKGDLLNLSDDVRDNKLKKLSVKLEDKGKGKPSIWKNIEES